MILVEYEENVMRSIIGYGKNLRAEDDLSHISGVI